MVIFFWQNVQALPVMVKAFEALYFKYFRFIMYIYPLKERTSAKALEQHIVPKFVDAYLHGLRMMLVLHIVLLLHWRPSEY